MRLSNTQERFNEIRTKLREWAVGVLGDDDNIVIAEESDPRPSGAHLSINMLGGIQSLGSNAERRTDGTTGRETTTNHQEFTVSLMAVGCPNSGNYIEDRVRAVDILNELKFSLEKHSTQAFFNEIDLVIADEGEITAIPATLETEIEPRAVLDIRCRARFDIVDEDHDSTSYFDSTKISGSVDTDGDGTFDKPIDEFTVNP